MAFCGDRQQCDLVSCFKGTFWGEWTVLCIRARCVLSIVSAVSIHCVYIHIDERGSLVAQQKWTCPFREVRSVLFFPLSFPRLCEIISHVLQ